MSDLQSRAVLIGAHLRDVRKARGLSLKELEERTEGRYKASVVGAYERGERIISAPRLLALAQFYGVDIASLFPPVSAAAEFKRGIREALACLVVQHAHDLVDAVPADALRLVRRADLNLSEALDVLGPTALDGWGDDDDPDDADAPELEMSA